MELIMMVGLQASGKSYYAKELAEQYNAKIFSSDEYREKLLGDETDQTNNSKIFSQLERDIINHLLSGESAIFDACNISSKRRRNFLNKVNKTGCEKICVVVLRKLEKCIEANNNRERKVPNYSITKYYKSFQLPYLEEGWDTIKLIYTDKDDNSVSVDEFNFKYNDYEQNSKYHSKTLGTHLWSTAAYIRDNYKEDADFNELYESAKLHDIGKPFCRTDKDRKGNIDGNIHYYGHENVGAYDSLFINYSKDVDNLLIAFLINNHMRPLNWAKSEEAKEKDKLRWGERKFNLICKLNEADKESH